MDIFLIAEAPICALCFYIFIRDKYEKEPIKLLLIGLTLGVLLAYPVLFTEKFLLNFVPKNIFLKNFYTTFIVASFTEEFFKLLFLFMLIWRNPNFNERFDAIVYSVFISLGFAGIENYYFVSNDLYNQVSTGVTRGIISVPAHFFYGVFMGYFLSYAKFNKDYNYVFVSFVCTFILHGFFDLIIELNFKYNIIVLCLFLLIMALNGSFKMIHLLDMSPFKNVKKTSNHN
ncbi:MAG: PrsW family intramembrane metalloprotease [Lachnospirales bacterium]